MSQPASPIGSVEFIVKFDSMQGAFVDALKEAMKDVEIDTGADPQLTSKIDEILDNLRNRLRGIWTGDRLQFLETAKPTNDIDTAIDELINDGTTIEPKPPGWTQETGYANGRPEKLLEGSYIYQHIV